MDNQIKKFSRQKKISVRLLDGVNLTIHKVQGATLTAGVANLGKKEKNLGPSFVEISRFKRFDKFLIEPFSFDRITSMIKKSKLYKPGLAVIMKYTRIVDLCKCKLYLIYYLPFDILI